MKYNGKTEVDAGADLDIVTQYFYVRLAVDEETGKPTVDPNTYYVLYQKDAQGNFVALGESTENPVVTTHEYTATVATNNKLTVSYTNNAGATVKPISGAAPQFSGTDNTITVTPSVGESFTVNQYWKNSTNGAFKNKFIVVDDGIRRRCSRSGSASRRIYFVPTLKFFRETVR